MAMAIYAQKIEKSLGVAIKVVGYDSGAGMPPPIDYRDHPEMYTEGDFPMIYREQLLAKLLPNTELVFIDLIKQPFAVSNFPYPIGFISIDVDYYSSTVSILHRLQELSPDLLLPNVVMYFDDIHHDNHNPYQGELLAISEFNEATSLRKISSNSANLRHKRVFKHAAWLDHIYQLHVLDHERRFKPYRTKEEPAFVLGNKYIK